MTKVRCHAGCPQEAIPDALGLDWRDFFDDDGRYQRETFRRRAPRQQQETVEPSPALERSIDRVLAALEQRDCQPRGSENAGWGRWEAVCPVHDGPGLTVTYRTGSSRGAHGVTSLECDAGCDNENFLSVLCLEPSDLRDDDLHDRARDESEGPIEPSLTPNALEKRLEPYYDRVNDGSKDGSMGLGSMEGSSDSSQDSSENAQVGDRTRARVEALGGSLDAPFRCLLHGHDHEARLRWSGRFWRYACPDCDLGLAEVRAAVAYGEVRLISPIEAQRWRERLDHEAGLMAAPAEVRVVIADGCAKATLQAARGIALYLGLRASGGGLAPEEPFTFARRFCMAWCGLTNQQAREAMSELKRSAAIKDTGERIDRAIVWELVQAGGPELPVEAGVSAAVPRELKVEAPAPAVELGGSGDSVVRAFPEPGSPVREQGVMDQAEAGTGADLGMEVTSGDSAGSTAPSIGHVDQPTLSGGPERKEPPGY
jgi:hypothetical protein